MIRIFVDMAGALDVLHQVNPVAAQRPPDARQGGIRFPARDRPPGPRPYAFEERSRRAIAEGRRYLDQGSLSHNYLHFYQNLIEVALNREDPESALEYADRLETHTGAGPLAWSNFYIARGWLLAQTLQRPVGEIQRQRAGALLERARIAGLRFGVPEMQAVAGEQGA